MKYGTKQDIIYRLYSAKDSMRWFAQWMNNHNSIHYRISFQFV